MNDPSEAATPLRLAHASDVAAIDALIRSSAHGLQREHYSSKQIEAALGPVFGVDRQLISDGTYFVITVGNEVIACGGWSRRRSQYGGDASRSEPDALLDPAKDAARIRAFFVHPDNARRGHGSAILQACKEAIRAAGFQHAEMVATLSGERLYRKFGYQVAERFEIPMRDGLTLPVVRMTKRF